MTGIRWWLAKTNKGEIFLFTHIKKKLYRWFESGCKSGFKRYYGKIYKVDIEVIPSSCIKINNGDTNKFDELKQEDWLKI